MTLARGPLPNQVIEECESTNDLARELGLTGAPHGTWISARRQTSGRGRQGREWISQDGNLFLSIVVRVAKQEQWTWVPLAAAVGILDAIHGATYGAIRGGALVDPSFPVRIKWPNDLWVDGAKLGGILCEAHGRGGEAFIVVGIGLNCALAPENVGQETTSLADIFPKDDRVRADALRTRIVDEIAARTARLNGESAETAVKADYEKWSALPSGSEIQWGGRSGRVRGLGPSGELLVDENGALVRLLAEDVRAVRSKAYGSRP